MADEAQIEQVMDSASWTCKCGDTFDEPENLNIHILRGAYQDGKGIHGSRGYLDRETGELVLGWHPQQWKGEWKNQLRRKLAGEPPYSNLPHTGGRNARNGSKPGGKKGSEARKDGPAIEERTGHQVRIYYKPVVHELPEECIHLYHLVTGSLQNRGYDYSPTFGEFMREVLFTYFMEHPELVDLRTLFTEEEQEAMR